eukprot:919108-Amorphochlora_amoeboformis.AAC.1
MLDIRILHYPALPISNGASGCWEDIGANREKRRGGRCEKQERERGKEEREREREERGRK